MPRTVTTRLNGDQAQRWLAKKNLEHLQLSTRLAPRLPVEIPGEGTRYEELPKGWTEEKLLEELTKVHGVTVTKAGALIPHPKAPVRPPRTYGSNDNLTGLPPSRE